MTTTNRQKLLALAPICRKGLARAAECATLREWWEASLVLSDMRWLCGRAHSHGTMTRRRLVAIALRSIETVAHLLPEESVADLGLLAEWCAGRDDVDLGGIRQRLWDRYAAVADAVYAAVYAAVAVVVDAADAVAAADAVYAVYAADAAMCDVLRDAVTIDELCACLGLDPDQGCGK